MSSFVLPPPPPPSVAVADHAARFAVRRIYCVGRNYAAHAREMGVDPDREPPFFFTKPADALTPSGATIPYPPLTTSLHHEIELVVAIGRTATAIPAAAAHDHVWGYGVGIDLTRRDLQQIAKEHGRPWDLSKGFDYSAPCAPLHPVAAVGHPQRGRIWLAVNGTVAQDGDLGEQIWPVPEIISGLSHAVTLTPGDLIFTGTPAGVGEITRGDHLRGGIEGLGEIELHICDE